MNHQNYEPLAPGPVDFAESACPQNASSRPDHTRSPDTPLSSALPTSREDHGHPEAFSSSDVGSPRSLVGPPPQSLAPDKVAVVASHRTPAWNVWKWEIGACFLSSLSIVTVAVTLYPHQGMPLPKWPFKISINSLLSIYSLVFKATLGFVLAAGIGQLQWTWFSSERRMYDLTLYDGAGRGVWGSLQLLSIQRLRQPLTALGAIIVSAALNASRGFVTRYGIC